MIMFKKKINYNDLLKLILQIGYERYNALNNDLKQEFYYNENYFYIIWQLINCFIFKRMLVFRKIISNDKDVLADFRELLCESILTELKDDLSLGIININNEINDIWKNDNDTNSNNEVNRTSNFLVNEMLECDDNENIELKLFFSQYLTDCHFENKKIIQNFKVV